MTAATARGSAPHARSAAARPYWPAVAVLTVAGFALRAWHMSAQNLWTDEVETAKIALLPMAELMRAARGELPILPTAWLSPLYYLIIRSALLLPHASVDAALRLSSVVVGAATVPALAWTGRRLLGAPAALAATVVLALSPFHVWYSQEVRPYALLVLLAVLTIGLFARALERPAAGTWAAFAGALILALYTHPIAVTLPLVCGLALLVAARTRPHLLRGGLLTLAASGVAYLPAVAVIRARGANTIADARGVSVLDVPYAIYTYVVGFSFGPSTAELHVSARDALLAAAPLILVVALVFGVLAMAGVLAIATGTVPIDDGDQPAPAMPTRVLVLAWLVLPLAIAFVSAAASGNPFNPRYSIIAFPALALVLGAGVVRVAALAPVGWETRVAGGALLLVAVLSGWSIYNLAFDPRYAKEDCRALGALLAREARPGDLVVVSAEYMDSAVRYYYDGPAEVLGYETPAGADAQSRVTADMRRLAGDRPHVWLVLSRAFDDSPRTLPAALDTLLVEDGRYAFPGVDVRRYTRRG